MAPVIRIRRAYGQAFKKDGYRVLVDRLWPRGISREEAGVDEWAKDLAPSVQLRKWWAHKPETWEEFQKRYRAELKQNKALDDFAVQHEGKKLITLVYGAKDEVHNHALVLQQYLEQR